jgi:hypothetical protein
MTFSDPKKHSEYPNYSDPARLFLIYPNNLQIPFQTVVTLVGTTKKLGIRSQNPLVSSELSNSNQKQPIPDRPTPAVATITLP